MISEIAHRRTSTIKVANTGQSVLVMVPHLVLPEWAGRCLPGRGYFARLFK
ncbi:hypothetical protein [Pseudomonas laurylsulfativorans]|uniref:hypothetical protein n=1 Tax=Pseudomonas laurylsulfativorans TaxID=1943631 RepID=UPI0013FE3ABA|nr:hypothetical protein [Pseudomonas laurylsulfativorans]